jgi:hypothetical protein
MALWRRGDTLADVEKARAVYPPGERKPTGYGPEERGHRHVRAHHVAGYAVNPHLGDAPHLASGADAGARPVGPGSGGEGAFGAGSVPAPGGGERREGYRRHLYRKSPPTDGPGCYLRKLSTPVGMVTQQPSGVRLTRSGSVDGYWRCLPGGPADAQDHRVRAQPEGGGASAEGVRGMVRKAGLPAGRRDPGAALGPDGDLLPVPPRSTGYTSGR